MVFVIQCLVTWEYDELFQGIYKLNYEKVFWVT